MFGQLMNYLKNLKPKYLGLRTIKTTLAVIVSALVMKYLIKDTAFFACIGAVVAMEKTMQDSWRAAVVRNVGTFIGGMVGIIFSQLTSNIILLGLGVIPIIFIENCLKKKQSIVPGCIVYFAVVYLNTLDTAISYGTRRILETFIGTVIGLLINYLVFPPKKMAVSEDAHIERFVA